MTTFGALQQEVLDHGFADGKYRPYVKNKLNDAAQRIGREVDLRTGLAAQTIATVAATATYSLSSDFARVVELTNTTDQDPLYSMELREYDDSSTASGKPTRWLVIGTNLTLYPTPDAAYSLRLRYYKLPATMSADADTPEFASDYHYLLTYWALKWCYGRENDPDMASYWGDQWDQGLQKLKGEGQNDSTDPTEPRVVGGYDDDPIMAGWYG